MGKPLASVINKRALTPEQGGVPLVTKITRGTTAEDDRRWEVSRSVPPRTESPEGESAASRQQAARSATPGQERAESGPHVRVPRQDADREAIVDFIRRASVRFRHARGSPYERRRCIWSHDDHVLPAGYFVEASRNQDTAGTATRAAFATVGQILFT